MTTFQKICHGWSLADWNDRLFHSVFASAHNGLLNEPVRQVSLPVGGLAEMLGIPVEDGEAQDIENAFVGLFRLPPTDFNLLFDARLILQDWIPENIPPFFAQLVFTLLIASGAEELSEGNFRRRLANRLGHLEGTNYPMTDLPLMWERLAEWLRSPVASEKQYRLLLLPDYGARDTKIGYSKCLAFPRWQDRKALLEALSESRLNAESDIFDILTALQSRRRNFSGAFQKVLESFEESYSAALRAGEIFPAQSHIFWSTLKDLDFDSAEVDASDEDEDHASARYKIMVRDGVKVEIDLLASDVEGVNRGHIEVHTRHSAEGEFDYILRLRDSTDSNGLLHLDTHSLRNLGLSNFDRSALSRSIEQGIIGIAENSYADKESINSLPLSGALYFLVNEKLAEVFEPIRRDANLTKIEVTSRWKLLGPIPVEMAPKFAARCLEVGTRVPWLCHSPEPFKIRLNNVCRAGGRALLLPGIMPDVLTKGVDAIKLDVYDESIGGFREISEGLAVKAPNHLTIASFVAKLVNHGRHHLRLRGLLSGKLVKSKQFFATGESVSGKYKVPKNKGQWLKEDVSGELVCLDGRGFDRRASGEISGKVHGIIEARSAAPRGMEDPDIISELEGISRVIDAVAAVGCNRRGVSEGLLREIIRENTTIKENDFIWILTQAGMLDDLANSGHFSRMFFPRSPICFEGSTAGEYLVGGLIPSLLRAQFLNKVKERKWRVIRNERQGIWFQPLTIRGPQSLHDFARVMGLELRRAGTPHKKCLLREILRETTAPLSVEPREIWRWNWELGFFESDGQGMDRWELEFHRYEQSPGVYVILRDKREVWRSHSRNYAICAAYSLRGQVLFELDSSSGILLRRTQDGALPHVIAQAILDSGGSVGLVKSWSERFFAYRLGKRYGAAGLFGDFMRGGSSAGVISQLTRWRELMDPQFRWRAGVSNRVGKTIL